MVRIINMGTMVITNESVFGSLTVALTVVISVTSVLEDRQINAITQRKIEFETRCPN